MSTRPVCLIIRDGWGMNARFEGNSVFRAKTPVIDRLRTRYPWCRIECSGEEVGLPDGYQGSSEVGHLNMGAGRIVEQELKRIDDGLKSGELFKSPKWEALIGNWKANKSQLHLMGLLQDEGVHAHQEHLFKIMRRARQENPEGKIVRIAIGCREHPLGLCARHAAALDPRISGQARGRDGRGW